MALRVCFRVSCSDLVVLDFCLCSRRGWLATQRNFSGLLRSLAASYRSVTLLAIHPVQAVHSGRWMDSAVLRQRRAERKAAAAGPLFLLVRADKPAGEAAGTLLKRASDVANKGRPLAAKEHELYAYLSHLRSTGASATSGESFVKAYRFFMHHWGNEEPWCVL